MGAGVTGDAIRGVAQGVFSAASTAAQQARAEHVFTGRTITHHFADAATAGTAYTETVIFHAKECGGTVKSMTIGLPVTAAGHASNGAVITLAKRTGAGGAVTIASWSTLTAAQGTLTAFIPGVAVLTAANVKYALGDVLTLAVSKAASGVALTAATSEAMVNVSIQEDDGA